MGDKQEYDVYYSQTVIYRITILAADADAARETVAAMVARGDELDTFEVDSLEPRVFNALPRRASK